MHKFLPRISPFLFCMHKVILVYMKEFVVFGDNSRKGVPLLRSFRVIFVMKQRLGCVLRVHVI